MDRQREQMHQMDQQIKELTARLNAGGQAGFTSPPPSAMNFATNGGTHYTNGIDSNSENRTLPPMLNGGAMQGVQYGENGR